MLLDLSITVGVSLILDPIDLIPLTKVSVLDMVQFMLNGPLALLVGQFGIYENRPASIIIWCYRPLNPGW